MHLLIPQQKIVSMNQLKYSSYYALIYITEETEELFDGGMIF